MMAHPSWPSLGEAGMIAAALLLSLVVANTIAWWMEIRQRGRIARMTEQLCSREGGRRIPVVRLAPR